MFSFPEALKALLQAGTKFDRNFIKSINPKAFKNNKVAKEFKKVLCNLIDRIQGILRIKNIYEPSIEKDNAIFKINDQWLV